MNEEIRNYEIQHMRKNMLNLYPGNTVEVKIWVIEGNKRRLQLFEGIIIAIKKRGLNSSFIVRKISSGEGVERVFQMHSPIIENIEIKKFGVVRKAKLYYLRNLKGKSARIRTRLG